MTDLIGMADRPTTAPGGAADGTDGPDPDRSPDGRGTTTAGGWWRRNRALVAIGAVLLLGVAAVVAGTPRGAQDPLDPTSAAADGSRALAQVLGRQGVEVREQSGLDTVVAEAGPGSTVLVLDAGVLDPALLRRLRGTGATLVLVEPSLPVLRVLAPELTIAGASPDYVAEPGCTDDDAVTAGEARGGGSRYVGAGAGVPGVEGEAPSPDAVVEVCYADGTREGAGSYATVTEPDGSRRVVVHGQPDVLTNEFLAQEGNAALALRSLGADPVLHWYRVDPFDVALGEADGQPPSVTDLLPRWVWWVAAQLVVVLVVTVVWRSRRLGRLVPERLPAVVRSAETTEGRARLYRGAGARGSVARLLRQASVRRLAGRLAGPSGADAVTVSRLAAARTGRDPVQVGALLHGPVPPDDAALVRLADDLDDLEREVGRA